MEHKEDLAVVRRAYAKQVLASVGVNDPRVEAAFAAVEREHSLGPGPWLVWRYSGYVPTPDADPVYLYSDVLIGIVPERGLNNGMPSYHAPLIASAGIREGEHVVHVGVGTGYYTAIMARLVGGGGRITAIEFDPALAQRARANLSAAANVQVLEGDGCSIPFDAADVIYVNAGATRLADTWLDPLNDGGRLMLPLTARKTLPLRNDAHRSSGTVRRFGSSAGAANISPGGCRRWAFIPVKVVVTTRQKPPSTPRCNVVAPAGLGSGLHVTYPLCTLGRL